MPPPGRARQGRSLPATYGVCGAVGRSGPPRPGTDRPAGHGKADLPATYVMPGALGLSWASDSANLATHSSQMKISVMMAKVLGSLTA